MLETLGSTPAAIFYDQVEELEAYRKEKKRKLRKFLRKKISLLIKIHLGKFMTKQ